MLENAVEVYDQYLRGEVYGFQCFELDPDTSEWIETDESCWGFYGDDLMENGMLDAVSGLAEAIEAEQYHLGEAHKVMHTTYQFD